MLPDVRGKTVVLTGAFSKIKRSDAEARLAALGATIGASVSKRTELLFAGERAGSKIQRATALGIQVLGEDELMAILAGGAEAGPPGPSPFASLDPEADPATLKAAIEALPWGELEVDRDLPVLRAILEVHERRQGGPSDAHRAATARLRPRAELVHAHGHDVEVEWADLSPDGRFLATGSWVGDDYDRGGVLQIWDVHAGRCVNKLRIRGGVGWPDYGGCVQWRPDGRRVGLAFDTNGVGSFDPFGKSGEPDSCAYITDGWSRPPSWVWSPSGREVYIACWGPKMALGAIVPLIGRSPVPRWCVSAEPSDPKDPNSEPGRELLGGLSWSDPSRIVGFAASDQLYAIDTETRGIAWEAKAHPPVSFPPIGAIFAMQPAGLVFYEVTSGLPTLKVPMHVGGESYAWTRDGVRVATIVQPGNKFGAEPGVFVYERGDYLCSPDTPAIPEGARLGASWSPDGERLAISFGERVQIWSIGQEAKLLHEFTTSASSLEYGDGVLVAWGPFGLAFLREDDGALLGAFEPAIEAEGESPLEIDGTDHGERWAWNPAFPVDRQRVAAALPEGVVIGPPDEAADAAAIDRRIAWVIDRKWAWPWRWGEIQVWEDAEAAAADPAAPTAFKRQFAKKSRGKASAAKGKGKGKVKDEPEAAAAGGAKAKARGRVTWPPSGGSLDAIAELFKEGVMALGDGYHSQDYRRKYAVRTMGLGDFARAAAAIDGEDGWGAWIEPWFSAYTRGEVALTALDDRIAAAPPLDDDQREVLRRWLREGEALLKKKAHWSLCRPLAVIGASWVLLGDPKRGAKLLDKAIALIEPENNTSEHRAVVARALAAIGRIDEAIQHLTEGPDTPSWTETPAAVEAIARHASAAELDRLIRRLKKRDAHNEFAILDRGIERLVELQAWDEALAWIGHFDRLSTDRALARVVAARVAAGDPAGAEEMIAKELKPKYQSSADFLLGLARVAPERARPHLKKIAAAAPKLLGGYYPVPFLENLAGAAARLDDLTQAAAIAALGRGEEERFAAAIGVVSELPSDHPAWGEWLARAQAALPDGHQEIARLAAQAGRGGRDELRDELLAKAVEVARAGSYSDIQLEEVARKMAEVGELAAAHRAWMSMPKGKRSYRNGPLLDACVERELWAAALEILRKMPLDINSGTQRAGRILLQARGREGW